MSIQIDATRRHAERLIESLIDDGPGTAEELCARLEWSRGRFTSALRFAREALTGELGISIPAPTPADGWTYQATTDWQPVEAGASYALGSIESRLRGIMRDVKTVMPHLTRGSVEWRRANFLDKHISHIVGTLGEINGSR
jgi:hypothetical protein